MVRTREKEPIHIACGRVSCASNCQVAWQCPVEWKSFTRHLESSSFRVHSRETLTLVLSAYGVYFSVAHDHHVALGKILE